MAISFFIGVLPWVSIIAGLLFILFQVAKGIYGNKMGIKTDDDLKELKEEAKRNGK